MSLKRHLEKLWRYSGAGRVPVNMPTACVGLSGAEILEATLGVLGTLTLMVSALTSHWYDGMGLWEGDPISKQTGDTNQTAAETTKQVRAAQLVFTGLSIVMAAASFCLCLVTLFGWTPPRRTQETRRTARRPGPLLLAVLLPTGLFFLLGWASFTWQRWEDIQNNRTSLGYSYWMGASAWTILLVILPASYLIDECSSVEHQKPIEVPYTSSSVLDPECLGMLQ
ncbi:hypothetical protein FKM82_020806 [Ascaphus truei]